MKVSHWYSPLTGPVRVKFDQMVHRVTKRTPYDIVFNYKIFEKFDNPLKRDIQKSNVELGTKEEKESVEELLEQNRTTLKE